MIAEIENTLFFKKVRKACFKLRDLFYKTNPFYFPSQFD